MTMNSSPPSRATAELSYVADNERDAQALRQQFDYDVVIRLPAAPSDADLAVIFAGVLSQTLQRLNVQTSRSLDVQTPKRPDVWHRHL